MIKRKLLSILLVICMVLSLVPMAVFAVGEAAKQLRIKVSKREIRAYAETHHFEMTDRLSKDRAAYWCLRDKVLETLCPMEEDVFSR